MTNVATVGSRGRVVIAGASGFIGRELARALSATTDIIALARRTDGMVAEPGVEWRDCDLFNLRDAERALAGAKMAFYLVHSMMPSSRLTQARFDDLDLICADNFARAAASNGVEHIVYLGGLLPSERDVALSRHLESRFEVERTLASHGVPVTTLRAGLILGAGGSSFQMMSRLVGRLPLMIAPMWTSSKTQPIALADAVALLVFAMTRSDLAGHAYDIGSPDVVTYAQMLRMTGAAMGRKTRVLTVPVRTAKLSLLWVSVVTGAPQALVRPLVESLQHDMVATDGLVLQKMAHLDASHLAPALERAVADERAHEVVPRKARRAPAPPDRRACSMQRLPLPAGRDAAWVAAEYARWLPMFMRPFLRVSVDDARVCRFGIWPLKTPLLVLAFSAERSSPDRQLFYVTGGLLAGEPAAVGARPRLEFRSVLDSKFVVAAVLDFVPRLPWFIYKFSQALVHLFVMRSFGRHLAHIDRPAAPAGALAH